MNVNIKNTETQKYINTVFDYNKGKDRLAAVITLGCQQNEADSEKIRAFAVEMGYTLTDAPEKADLIVVNTCAVRRHAELKALSIVGNFKALKKEKSDLVIGVCGCMAAEPHIAQTIKKSYPQVSFTLEPSGLHRFPELVCTSLLRRRRSFVFGSEESDVIEGMKSVRQSGFKAWVSIMYGCNNFCSYCIVPYVRGRERSRESQEVIAECRELVRRGYKEITLLGQNVNSYKSDRTFAELIEEIANIEGDFIIRFMTSHPKDVSDELIEVIGKYTGKIVPAFHLPLQSGSDRILKEMNRTYNTEGYLQTVRKLRAAVPEIALTSDIIVGFPTETDEDFENTIKVLELVRFDMVYSFIYSKREGTKAAKMESKISEDVKKARMARLLDVQCRISHEINDTYIGKTVKVLVDSYEDKNGVRVYNARTLTNKLVHFEAESAPIGEFISVKISRAGAFDLFGSQI